MVRIRMDTAEATRVAGQCLDEVNALLQQMEHLRTSLDSLASSWSGRSYNRLSPQFDPAIRQGTQIAEQLRALGEDLQRIATALEIADAGGTAAFLAPLLTKLKERFARWVHAPSPPVEIPDAPKNAQELFKSIDNMKHPIGIYKIGENEYVVLLQGTKTAGFGRNWGAAIQEGLGVPAAYEREVRRLMAQAIPEGATVHLVGYSQGGFVANSIADNQDILSRYHVDSVVTYGAAPPAHRTKGVEYRNYAVAGDIVPMLDRHHILEVAEKEMRFGPLALLFPSVRARYDPSLRIVSGEGDNFLEKHIEGYKTSPELAAEALPFRITQWELVQTGDAQMTDGLSQAAQRFHQEGNIVAKAVAVTDGVVRAAGYTATAIVRHDIDRLPDPIYPVVDAVRDKIDDFIGQL